MYKIIADSGANVKKAFCETKSMDNDYTDFISQLLDQVNIEEAVSTESITVEESEQREESEKTESDFNLNLSAESNEDTLLDADLDAIIEKATNLNENEESINLNEFDESELAYLACVCHILQLAINDAFKLIKYFFNLVKKISHFISKCRVSTIIKNELIEMKKTLLKNVVTRWNSIYFMVRSYNKITANEIKTLISKIKPSEQKRCTLTFFERERAVELESVLDILLYATKEFESDKCSSSLVYPTINYLKFELLRNLDDCSKQTKALRQQLFKNIVNRFGTLMYNDVFCFSTYLNPEFGPLSFPPHDKARVKENLIKEIRSLSEKTNISENIAQNKNNVLKFHDRFIKYTVQSDEPTEQADELNDYTNFVIKTDFNSDFCVLNFWKVNENRWPVLAKIAKKVLGVPASSAAAERMFSWSGHIFSSKRRTMKAKTLASLVFLKLNEDLY